MGAVSELAGAKPGAKTTEFWVAQITAVVLAAVPIANAVFGWNIEVTEELFFGAAAAVQGAYVASRTVVKAFADGVSGRTGVAASEVQRASSDARAAVANLEAKRAEVDLERVRLEAAKNGKAE